MFSQPKKDSRATDAHARSPNDTELTQAESCCGGAQAEPSSHGSEQAHAGGCCGGAQAEPSVRESDQADAGGCCGGAHADQSKAGSRESITVHEESLLEEHPSPAAASRHAHV